MSENHTIPPAALGGLPSLLVAVHHLWKEGYDLQVLYPRKIFYRYRKALQETTAVRQGNRKKTKPNQNPNVIEFRRVLRPERYDQIPSWVIGIPLYFELRTKVS